MRVFLECGVAGQNALGLNSRVLNEFGITDYSQQLQAASASRLAGPENISLAAKLEVNFTQLEAVES